jgi:hypothetical protein
MLARLLLLLCLGLTGCRFGGREDPGTAPSASAAPPALETPGVAEASPIRITAAVATFTGDTLLDECDDFVLTLPPGIDAGAKALDRLVESLKKGRQGETSRFDKPCAEQFPSDPVLATCTVSAKVKGDLGIVERAFTGRYYDLGTLQSSDVTMKSCIGMNGKWETVAHDSKEWREAHIAWAHRQVEKLQKEE